MSEDQTVVTVSSLTGRSDYNLTWFDIDKARELFEDYEEDK